MTGQFKDIPIFLKMRSQTFTLLDAYYLISLASQNVILYSSCTLKQMKKMCIKYTFKINYR